MKRSVPRWRSARPSDRRLITGIRRVPVGGTRSKADGSGRRPAGSSHRRTTALVRCLRAVHRPVSTRSERDIAREKQLSPAEARREVGLFLDLLQQLDSLSSRGVLRDGGSNIGFGWVEKPPPGNRNRVQCHCANYSPTSTISTTIGRCLFLSGTLQVAAGDERPFGSSRQRVRKGVMHHEA